MKFLITTTAADGVRTKYIGLGARDALTDAAYDAGAMGVTALALA